MSGDAEVSTAVNGTPWTGTVPVRLTLADFLRERLRLTGTHVGCEQGVCGACTVLLDGVAVRSCLVLAVQAQDAEVTTVEGLGGPQLSALQDAFLRHRALQCGFCTPGQIVSAVALVDAKPAPSKEEIRHAMAGNLCRCGAYPKIEEAILTWQD